MSILASIAVSSRQSRRARGSRMAFKLILFARLWNRIPYKLYEVVGIYND